MAASTGDPSGSAGTVERIGQRSAPTARRRYPGGPARTDTAPRTKPTGNPGSSTRSDRRNRISSDPTNQTALRIARNDQILGDVGFGTVGVVKTTAITDGNPGTR